MSIGMDDTISSPSETAGLKRKIPSDATAVDQVRNVRPKRDPTAAEQQLLTFQLKSLIYVPVDSGFFLETVKSVQTLWRGKAVELSKTLIDSGASAEKVKVVEDVFQAALQEEKLKSYMRTVAIRLHSLEDLQKAIISLLDAFKECKPELMNAARLDELKGCIDAYITSQVGMTETETSASSTSASEIVAIPRENEQNGGGEENRATTQGAEQGPMTPSALEPRAAATPAIDAPELEQLIAAEVEKAKKARIKERLMALTAQAIKQPTPSAGQTKSNGPRLQQAEPASEAVDTCKAQVTVLASQANQLSITAPASKATTIATPALVKKENENDSLFLASAQATTPDRNSTRTMHQGNSTTDSIWNRTSAPGQTNKVHPHELHQSAQTQPAGFRTSTMSEGAHKSAYASPPETPVVSSPGSSVTNAKAGHAHAARMIPRPPPASEMGCWFFNLGPSGCYRTQSECMYLHEKTAWIAGRSKYSAHTYHGPPVHERLAEIRVDSSRQCSTPIIDHLWGSHPISHENKNRVCSAICVDLKQRAKPHEYNTYFMHDGRQQDFNLTNNSGLLSKLSGTIGKSNIDGEEIRSRLEHVLRSFVRANKVKFPDLHDRASQ